MTALLLLLGAVLLVSTGLAALLLRRVPDPYPPEAAEAPGLDCGCAIGSVVLGCMVCSRTSCPTHQVHDHDPYPPEAAEALTYERARLLDEVGPCIVAGSDFDRADRQSIAKVNARLARILAEDKELTELDALDLSAYYVLPEGER